MSPQRQPATRPTRRPHARLCGSEIKGRQHVPRPDAPGFPSPSSSKKGREEKKQKYDNFSPSTYDRLPQVYLTVRALRELDRRNCEKSPSGQPVPVALSVSNISRFARRGGPSLRHIRGYRDPAEFEMAPSATASPAAAKKSTPAGSKAKKSSAYDDNFESLLLENNIYMPLHPFPDKRPRPKPKGFEELRRRLLEPRTSLAYGEFNEDRFEAFEEKNNASAEGTVMFGLIPTIAGTSDIPNECGVVFANLSSMTNESTVRPVPDFFDGANLETVHLMVRQALNEIVLPTKRAAVPIVPNLFLEAKASSGSVGVAKRQACYDGAHGARAMHALQNYGVEMPLYDGRAYTYSATYQSGSSLLQLYAHHITEGSNGRPEYHMTKLCGFDMTNSIESFIQGASAFRNARDMAREHRDALIQAANARAAELAALELFDKKVAAAAVADSLTPEDGREEAEHGATVGDEGDERADGAPRNDKKRRRRSSSAPPGLARKKRKQQ